MAEMHIIRGTDGTRRFVKNMTPRKAIRHFCTECMGFDGDPKKECTSPMCALYPYRGKVRISAYPEVAGNGEE